MHLHIPGETTNHDVVIDVNHVPFYTGHEHEDIAQYYLGDDEYTLDTDELLDSISYQEWYDGIIDSEWDC